MRVFLTGSSGLLGRYLLRTMPLGYYIAAIYRSVEPMKGLNITPLRIDVTNFLDLKKEIRNFKPDVIIHAASYGNVDFCENHKKEAREMNYTITKKLYKYCLANQIKFVFISTNAIYDGENPLYSENATPKPLDYYGKTKHEAEVFISQFKSESLIIRLMTMYGWNDVMERKNPATWVIDELGKKNKIHVVDDIYNNCLYAKDAAYIVWELIVNKKKGVFNVSGSEVVSRYEFSKTVASTFNLPTNLIVPVKSDFFKSLAPRPKNTSFNISKIVKTLGFTPRDIDSGLKDMKVDVF